MLNGNSKFALLSVFCKLGSQAPNGTHRLPPHPSPVKTPMGWTGPPQSTPWRRPELAVFCSDAVQRCDSAEQNASKCALKLVVDDGVDESVDGEAGNSKRRRDQPHEAGER